MEMGSQLHAPAALPLGNNWIGGWVDRKAGLNLIEERKPLPLPGIELRSSIRSVVTILTELPHGNTRKMLAKNCYSYKWSM
jgi:hypothetical protein